MVARGLHDLHWKDVLHRSLTTDNILFRPNGDIKIADMGFAVLLNEQERLRKVQRGTLLCMSPEIAAGDEFSKEADVWAFGCLALELALGRPPFEHLLGNVESFMRTM